VVAEVDVVDVLEGDVGVEADVEVGVDAGAGKGASSWGGAVLADTVNATSSSVNHPSKAVIASQDMCTVCKHRITPC
jgi:hypothetical protein